MIQGLERIVGYGAVVIGGLVAATVDATNGPWLEAVAKQIPNMIALVVVVALFLRHQERRDKLFSDALDRSTQREQDALVENSKALRENAEVIGEMKGVIQVLDLRVRSGQRKPDDRVDRR